jgi:mono/diheme cytochrome c family protein
LFNSRLLRSLRWGLLVAVASVGLASCDEKLSDLTGPTPNLQPTLTSIQSEIFSQRCAGCHTTVGRVAPQGLNLTEGNAFNNLVGVAARGKAGSTRVVPGDPDNSYLIQKIEGAPGISGVRMPFQGTPLTDGQILVIRRWIQTGAANN